MQALNKGQMAEIKIETAIEQGDEVYRHAFEEMGRVLELNGNYYIRFEENDGADQVSVTIKIAREGYVQLIRNGEITTRLVFNKQFPQEFTYETPTGRLGLLVRTDVLDIHLKDSPFSGQLAIDYAIMSNEQALGTYKLRLQFTT